MTGSDLCPHVNRSVPVSYLGILESDLSHKWDAFIGCPSQQKIVVRNWTRERHCTVFVLSTAMTIVTDSHQSNNCTRERHCTVFVLSTAMTIVTDSHQSNNCTRERHRTVFLLPMSMTNINLYSTLSLRL